MLRSIKINSNSITNGFNTVKTAIKTRLKNNLYNSMIASPWGFFGKPLKNANAVMGNTQRHEVILGYLMKAVDGLEDGESIVYSKTPTGDISATIISRGNKTIEFLGDDDNLVRYSNLETEFNKLKSSLSTHISNYNDTVAAFGTHTHLYFPGTLAQAPTLVPTTSGTPSVADGTININNAKHEGLKTNKN